MTQYNAHAHWEKWDNKFNLVRLIIKWCVKKEKTKQRCLYDMFKKRK